MSDSVEILKNSTEHPLVSVVMPCYNSEQFIVETINSVTAQTYTNWELLVVDDCSSDRSVSLIEQLEAQDSRIHLLINAKNSGVSAARNRGMDICKGKYIALLDSDDLWKKEKLAKQVELAKETKADIVYCSYGMIDESNQKLWTDFIVPPKTDLYHMLDTSVISCSTALFSKEIADNYRFPQQYINEDYAFWMTLLKDGFQARGVQEVLAEYRVRKNSRAYNKLHVAKGRWEIYRKVLGLTFGKSIQAFWKYTINGIRKYTKQPFT